MQRMNQKTQDILVLLVNLQLQSHYQLLLKEIVLNNDVKERKKEMKANKHKCRLVNSCFFVKKDSESNCNTFKNIKFTPKNKINKINSAKEFNEFISRNSFNKDSKTNFDSEHFSIGSPLLEHSQDIIDRVNLPNATLALTSLTNENYVKKNENKKMNEKYNFTTQLQSYLRPTIEKNLLKSTSMVSFDPEFIKDVTPNKRITNNQRNGYMLNLKYQTLNFDSPHRKFEAVKYLNKNMINEFKEKIRNKSKNLKDGTKAHFILGKDANPLRSISKDTYILQTIQEN